MNRRNFLITSAAAGAAVSAAEPVSVGLIGAGGRGRFHIGEFKEIGARVGAVCDVYEPNLKAGLKSASTGAKEYRDYRRLLDDKSIEAVIVATPDHWHARMTIDAVEAGKDVYVEKPLCHEIPEGSAMVEAVRRTKRIVQVGTQRRSHEMFIEAKKLLDAQSLGPIRLVSSWWMNHQDGLSSRKLEGALDWKQWLGTAPAREMDSKRFFNWYYYWDYSGGLLVGQAAHIVDAVHWFMGSSAPLAVTCVGGQVNLPGAEVPETAALTVEYPENYLSSFVIGYKAMRYHTFHDQLEQFHGSKARLDISRERYALIPENQTMEIKPSVEVTRPGSFGASTRAHIRNFLECVRTRQEPNAPVEAGLSTAIVLSMAMDSMRQGRRLKWNAKTRKVEV